MHTLKIHLCAAEEDTGASQPATILSPSSGGENKGIPMDFLTWRKKNP